MAVKKKLRKGASILEYVLIMATCVIFFVPILIPITGSGRLGLLYESVRWAFQSAVVFISMPLL